MVRNLLMYVAICVVAISLFWLAARLIGLNRPSSGPTGHAWRRGGRHMARKRSMSLAALAVGALVGALSVVGTSAARPVRSDATAVTQWNEVAVNTVGALPGPNGGAPPAFQINMGMVQGAVYDAVNTIGPRQHQPYLLKRRFGAKASVDAQRAKPRTPWRRLPTLQQPPRCSRHERMTADSGHRSGCRTPPRALAAADQPCYWAAGPRPDPVGGRGGAVPDRELVATHPADDIVLAIASGRAAV